jgi:hypothetical protein
MSEKREHVDRHGNRRDTTGGSAMVSHFQRLLEYVKKVLTRSTPETLGMARERRRSRRSRGLYHLCVGKIIGLSRVSGLRINVGGVVWEI